MLSEIIISISVLFISVYFYIRNKRKHFPPYNKESITETLAIFTGTQLPAHFLRWTKELGPIFAINIPEFSPIVIITDVAIAKLILEGGKTDKSQKIRQGEKLSLIKRMVPNNIPTLFTRHTYGEKWEVYRKFIAPAFSYTNLYKFLPVLYKSLDSYLDLLKQKERDDEAINPLDVFQYLFFDAVGIGMFHRDMHVMQEGSLGHTLYHELHIWLQEFGMRRIFNPIRKYLPRDADGRRGYQAYETILSICRTILQDYRSTNTTEEIAKDSSILSYIVRCPYDTEAERVEEMYAFIIAGYETTAVSLSWVVIEIARNPQVLQRLQSEVDAVDKDTPYDHQNTSTMSYMQAVINEAMRLWAIGLSFGRVAEADISYNGYVIPKGASCIVPHITLFREGLTVSYYGI